jgi:hypothetical protein
VVPFPALPSTINANIIGTNSARAPQITSTSASTDQSKDRQHDNRSINIAVMATSSSRGPDRSIHQDYIARIRYSNTLPPPPNPPKLLEIPNTGLSSGQYTTPGFASRLAREQPLNIEADAELGMHIDLVGMPGVFDGDESCKCAQFIGSRRLG